MVALDPRPLLAKVRRISPARSTRSRAGAGLICHEGARLSQAARAGDEFVPIAIGPGAAVMPEGCVD